MRLASWLDTFLLTLQIYLWSEKCDRNEHVLVPFDFFRASRRRRSRGTTADHRQLPRMDRGQLIRSETVQSRCMALP